MKKSRKLAWVVLGVVAGVIGVVTDASDLPALFRGGAGHHASGNQLNPVVRSS